MYVPLQVLYSRVEENTVAFYHCDKQLQPLYQGLTGTDHTKEGGVVLRRIILHEPEGTLVSHPLPHRTL